MADDVNFIVGFEFSQKVLKNTKEALQKALQGINIDIGTSIKKGAEGRSAKQCAEIFVTLKTLMLVVVVIFLPRVVREG